MVNGNKSKILKGKEGLRMQTTEAIKRKIAELEEQRKVISKEIRQLKTTPYLSLILRLVLSCWKIKKGVVWYGYRGNGKWYI